MKKVSLLLLIVLVMLSCMTNPVTGKNQFSLVDKEWEIQTGNALYPLYTQENFGTYPNAKLQAYIQKVGVDIARVTHQPDFPYEFNGLNSPDLNAYALPGGKISITRPLLNILESESQMAAVLAHEAAHVNLRHSAIGYSRQIFAQALLLGVMIYTEMEEVEGKEYYQLGSILGSQLTLLHFSRKQEIEADTYGMEYMVKAGYDPRGMVQVQEILSSLHPGKESKFMNIFQTHPLSSERIKNARALIESRYQERGDVGRERYRHATATLRKTAQSYDQFDRGMRALGEKKYREAIKLLTSASGELPDHAVVHAVLGFAFQENKQAEQGYRAAAKAVRVDPNIFHGQFVAGVTSTNLRRYRRAIVHLLEADRLIPGRTDISYLLAENYEHTGNAKKAKEYYSNVARDGSGELQQLALRKLSDQSPQ